jgi:hypothetical protein
MRCRAAIALISVLPMLMPTGICTCGAATCAPAMNAAVSTPVNRVCSCHCKSHGKNRTAEQQSSPEKQLPTPTEHSRDCLVVVNTIVSRSAAPQTPALPIIGDDVASWLIVRMDVPTFETDHVQFNLVHDPPLYLAHCSYLI